MNTHVSTGDSRAAQTRSSTLGSLRPGPSRLRWAVVLVIGTGLGMVLLGLIGEAISHSLRWSPPPHEVVSPTISEAARALMATDSAPVRFGTESEEVDVGADGAVLEATIVSPTGLGPFPGVVLVHGAGPGERDDYMELAEAFARAGVVAAVYDKRSEGGLGDGRDFDQLASDASAVLHAARERDDVDAQRVGLWGLSEGGRVIPQAASRDPDVAFLITVSAATHSPLRNGSWTVTESVLGEGGPGTLASAAVRVLGARSAWTSEPAPPADLWTGVTQPTLVIFGARDSVVPPLEGAERIAAGLCAGGNHAWSVRFFADAGHSIGLQQPGYLHTMTDWIQNHPRSGAVGEVGGEMPQQQFASNPAPAPWWAGLPATGVIVVLSIAATLMPRLLRRRQSKQASAAATLRAFRRATVLSGASFGSMIAVAGLTIGLAYTRLGTGWIYHTSWAGVRVLAVIALACAVAAGLRILLCSPGSWSRVDRTILVVQSLTVAAVLLSLAGWGVFSWKG